MKLAIQGLGDPEICFGITAWAAAEGALGVARFPRDAGEEEEKRDDAKDDGANIDLAVAALFLDQSFGR